MDESLDGVQERTMEWWSELCARRERPRKSSDKKDEGRRNYGQKHEWECDAPRVSAGLLYEQMDLRLVGLLSLVGQEEVCRRVGLKF